RVEALRPYWRELYSKLQEPDAVAIKRIAAGVDIEFAKLAKARTEAFDAELCEDTAGMATTSAKGLADYLGVRAKAYDKFRKRLERFRQKNIDCAIENVNRQVREER